MTTNETSPLGSECNAELGPDSERAKFDAWANENWMLIDDPGSSYQVWLAGVAAERERCAKLCEAVADEDNEQAFMAAAGMCADRIRGA